MTLQYRGISYQITRPSQNANMEIAEGIYHGLKTSISLPFKTQNIEPGDTLITYRGVKLAS